MIKIIKNWLLGKNKFPVATLNRTQRMLYLGITQTEEKDYIKKYN